MPPLRRSQRQAEAACSRFASYGSDSSLNCSKENSHQPSILRDNGPSPSSTFPSEQTNHNLPISSNFPGGKDSLPFAAELPFRIGDTHRRFPLKDVDFDHSLVQCLLICALKMSIKTEDGEHLTDDTVSMIMTYRYDMKERPFECTHVYQYLRSTKGDRNKVAVQMIWRELEKNYMEWARVALRCYWQWMEYMRGIWNR